jgi:hypothetical protein
MPTQCLKFAPSMSPLQTQRLTVQGQDGKQTKKPPCPEPSNHFVLKEIIIMNSKLLYAATVAIALLASGAAMASEATQFDTPPGALTRAEVNAEWKRAQAAGELNEVSAAYGDFARIGAGVRSRPEVRAEARAEARSRRIASQYIGA